SIRLQITPQPHCSRYVTYATLLHFSRPLAPIFNVRMELRYSKSKTPSGNRMLPKLIPHSGEVFIQLMRVELAVQFLDVGELKASNDHSVALTCFRYAEVIQLLQRQEVIPKP